MTYEKVVLESMTLVGFQSVGKVAASSQAWPKLNDFLALTRIATVHGRAVGIQYTDETFEECQYDMGFSVDPKTVDRKRLGPVFEKTQYPYFKFIEVEGGTFVHGTHRGAYYGVPNTYHELLDAAKADGLDVVPLPYVQFYTNHPRFEKEEDLQTEIFIRIKDGSAAATKKER